MADQRLFDNCRPFLPREIEILAPDVLVTQGNRARDVVEFGIYENEETRFENLVTLDTCEDGDKVYTIHVIELFGREIVWFHTYHPGAWGNLYNDQKVACFEQWADVIHWHLTFNGWGED